MERLVPFACLELEYGATSALASQLGEHLVLYLRDSRVCTDQEFVGGIQPESFQKCLGVGNDVLADENGVASATGRANIQGMVAPELSHVQDFLDDMNFGVVIGTFYTEICLGVVGFPFLEHDLDLCKAFLVAQVGK